MDSITIDAGCFPNQYPLTISVGDRVKHWSGITGTVTAIYRKHQSYILGDAVDVINVIEVREDKRARQRRGKIECR